METQTRLNRHNKFISAEDRACKRVIWRDGEYTYNIFRWNKFIMMA